MTSPCLKPWLDARPPRCRCGIPYDEKRLTHRKMVRGARGPFDGRIVEHPAEFEYHEFFPVDPASLRDYLAHRRECHEGLTVSSPG